MSAILLLGMLICNKYYLKHCCQYVWAIVTAWGESQAENITYVAQGKAQGKAEFYICHETLTKSCILLCKWSVDTFKCFIVLYTIAKC